MPKNFRKIIFIVLLVVIFIIAIAMINKEKNIEQNNENNVETNESILDENDNNVEETRDLHISMDKWNYDETNNVYWQLGISYCANPVDENYQAMQICVPGDYFIGTKNSDGTYTCEINTSAKINGYTAQTAPISIPVSTPAYSSHIAINKYSYSDVAEHINAGFIFVQVGCRGKENATTYEGGAPLGVTDLKAAIRYLRYNGDILPGDTDSIFVVGLSGGGGQGIILASSGDSELYTPYLEEIGAIMQDENGNKISDSVAGVMAWGPVSIVDYANTSYEWEMGQYSTEGTRDESSWTSAFSDDLAESYAEYVNKLGLIDENGNKLTLTDTEDGIYTNGSYYNYILDIIEESLNNYLSDNYNSVSEMETYINSLNKTEKWVTFNQATKTASISSIGAFVRNCRSELKDVGAFDDLNREQAENDVFGNYQNDSLHFDKTMAELLTENKESYRAYSDYKDYSLEYSKDLSNVDSFGKTIQDRQNMYNPMYYLSNSYEGYNTSKVAKYWRIRSGIEQSDVGLTVETNLILSLKQNSNVKDIEYATVWGYKHSTDEQKNHTAEENFVKWINDCLK